jgi:transposase
VRRYELSQAQWKLVEGEFGPAHRRGRPRSDLRKILNAIMWILHSGASWRDLPPWYGPWKTVHHHFLRWSKDGTFDRILKKLQIRLDAQGQIDWDIFMVDGTNVRASKAAAGAGEKGGPESLETTHWVAQEAGLVPRSISFAILEESRLPLRSPRARSTNARSSNA